MSAILISTIVRDREASLGLWYNQLKELVQSDPSNKYFLSVYENDSTDSSLDILNSFNYSFFEDSLITSETLSTETYGSVRDGDRVNNLARARNKTIDEFNSLNDIDFVLCVEPDVKFSAKKSITSVINLMDSGEYDVLSGMSFLKYTDFPPLYDNWATRKSPHDDGWDFSVSLEGMVPVWSTFNCFCIYKSEPFKNKIRFSGFNKRVGAYDCDTTVICENFRSEGYNNIYMNCDFKVEHLDYELAAEHF